MNLKTDYGWSGDDFVQADGTINELTVTITLCEYRNLIRDRQRHEVIIEGLNSELKKSRESMQTFAQMVSLKSPEVIDKLVSIIEEFIPKAKAEAEEGEVDGQNRVS